MDMKFGQSFVIVLARNFAQNELPLGLGTFGNFLYEGSVPVDLKGSLPWEYAVNGDTVYLP
jgi:hypothetical protein